MSVCSSSDSNFLNFDTTNIAGYVCVSTPLYWSMWVVAVLIQIARNFVWTKTSQVSRLALRYPKDSYERSKYVNQLLIHTVIAFLLYVFSFLLILGANMGILFAVLLGNVAGVYISMNRQEKDGNPISVEMVDMLKGWDAIENNKNLSGEQRKELDELRILRKELANFLRNSESAAVKSMTKVNLRY